MNLSEYVVNELAKLIKDYNKGKEWVLLMNKYGSNEVYDNALPDIGKANGLRPSKTEYLTHWFRKLNNSLKLQDLILEIVCGHWEDIGQVNALLRRDGLEIVNMNGKPSIIGNIIDEQEVAIEAHFKNIETQIINEIDKAEVSIWIAMAWFTNERIYTKLKQKQSDDVDIRMVIYYDEINKKNGVNVKDFNTTFVKKAARGGIMHDKFCIIDSHIVITGSYNWSDNAEFKNDENITVSVGRELALEYSKEFKRLKRECKVINLA
ncbi:MAG: phosphatidylserine synthase [Alistipes sp.]|nr:phosphatidylserine synthase [Alistipes sp.]